MDDSSSSSDGLTAIPKPPTDTQKRALKRGDPCTIAGCTSKVIARGVCTAHGAMGVCLFQGNIDMFFSLFPLSSWLGTVLCDLVDQIHNLK